MLCVCTQAVPIHLFRSLKLRKSFPLPNPPSERASLRVLLPARTLFRARSAAERSGSVPLPEMRTFSGKRGRVSPLSCEKITTALRVLRKNEYETKPKNWTNDLHVAHRASTEHRSARPCRRCCGGLFDEPTLPAGRVHRQCSTRQKLTQPGHADCAWRRIQARHRT